MRFHEKFNYLWKIWASWKWKICMYYKVMLSMEWKRKMAHENERSSYSTCGWWTNDITLYWTLNNDDGTVWGAEGRQRQLKWALQNRPTTWKPKIVKLLYIFTYYFRLCALNCKNLLSLLSFLAIYLFYIQIFDEHTFASAHIVRAVCLLLWKII